ncbi:hypothetical protein B566_EDAN006186 [Ephemera danica]|nr:hypothetical protein B566_EDAN006186 [Ephemera danica]
MAQKNEKPKKEKEQFLLVLPPEGAPVLPGNLTSILKEVNLRNKTTSAPLVCNATSYGLASTGKRGWWNGLRKVYLRRRRRHVANSESESSSEEDPDYGQEYEEVLVVEKRRIFKNNNHCLNYSRSH